MDDDDFVEEEIWSAVIGYDGYATEVELFDSEEDAKRGLNNMKLTQNFDIIEGEQLLNKRIGRIK